MNNETPRPLVDPEADIIILHDVAGRPCSIRYSELGQMLAAANLTVYGMDLRTIDALRTAYLRLGGALPATVETVKDVFG